MDKLTITRSFVPKAKGQQPSGTAQPAQPAWQGDKPEASNDAMEVDSPPYDPFNAPDDTAGLESSDEDEVAQPQDDTLPDAGPVLATPAPDALGGGAMTELTDSLPPVLRSRPQQRKGAKQVQQAAPRALTGAEVLADYNRRVKAAEEKKRKRDEASPDGRAEEVAKQQKQTETDTAAATHDPAATEEPTQPTPLPFKNIKNFPRKEWCAIRVGADPNCGAIGNPYSQNPGIQISLSLDAGRYGKPSVGLSFKIDKGSKEKSVSKDEDERHTFAVGWQPGVKIDGRYMMDSFDARAGDQLQGASFPKRFEKLNPTQKKREKLHCIKFMCCGTKSSFYDPAWANDLGEDEQNTLRKLFVDVDPKPLLIMIWFVNPFAHNDVIEKDCLHHLKDAVDRHLPPLHQYKDEEGNPRLHLTFPRPINVIGDGMYCNYKLDKNGKIDDSRPNFYNFPREIFWDDIKDFYIYQGVPIVREAQYTKGSIGGLQQGVHHAFFQSAPYLRVGNKKISGEKWIASSCFYVGVRITPNARGIKEASPDEGSVVRFNLSQANPAIGKPASQDEIWTGHVVRRPKEWFAITQTDFCVMLTKPRNANAPKRVYGQEQNRTNDQLQLVKIEVKFNEAPVNREIVAMNKFCDEGYIPELLSDARQAFVSNPSQAPPQEETDLSAGRAGHQEEFNRQKYRAYIQELANRRKANPKQLSVLRSACKMWRRLACIAGPPGTGKTRSLRQLVVGLRYVGHKFLVVAPSNVAVDNDATAVYENMPEDLRKDTKMLRLEVGAAEAQAILTQLNYTDFEGLKASDPAKYKELKDAMDSPELTNAMNQMMVEYAQFDDELARLAQLGKRMDDVKEMYRQIQKSRRLKTSNVPVGMTLGYRMWEIMQDDKRHAEETFEARKAENSPEAWAELMSGPNSISVDEFNSSIDYKNALEDYVLKDGKLNSAQKTHFNGLRYQMLCRVLEETQILFTTCNNAGSDLLSTGAFQPTIICCDEAGQATCAGLFISMTNFTKWEGVFLFGDEKQLQPIMLAGAADEFVQNAKLSPQVLLMLKDFPNVVRLDTQYRMARAISAYPSHVFYDDELKDDPSVDAQHANKDIMLNLTNDLGIEGPKGAGSEYVVINVAYGVSRQEKNGKSLVNHANADAMLQFLEELIKRGVPASDLKVLCYYRGQTRLMRTKIDDTDTWTDATKSAIEVLEISTVDAFQGKESDLVLLDFVAAKDKFLGPSDSRTITELEADDAGTEDYISHGVATAHVRNPHRLCVALTRAKCGLFVFCQQLLLEKAFKARQGRITNAVTLMIENARDRKLIVYDDVHQDSSEEGQHMRQQWSEQALKQAREQQDADDLVFVRQMQHAKTEEAKKLTAKPKVDKPVYKTLERRTTRIIGSRVETDRADAHDSNQAANKGKVVEFKQGSLTFNKPKPAADKDKDVTMSDAASDKNEPVKKPFKQGALTFNKPKPAADKAKDTTMPKAANDKTSNRASSSKQTAEQKLKASAEADIKEQAEQLRLKQESRAKVAADTAKQTQEAGAAESASGEVPEAGEPALVDTNMAEGADSRDMAANDTVGHTQESDTAKPASKHAALPEPEEVELPSSHPSSIVSDYDPLERSLSPAVVGSDDEEKDETSGRHTASAADRHAARAQEDTDEIVFEDDWRVKFGAVSDEEDKVA